MTSSEIRNSFLKFFQEHGHTIVPSSPVVPYDDPTLLFANAGMNQFKDVFLGSGKRNYSRAADTQKCIRVSGKHNDLEEVGRDTYHHTFFEMLGNWSFGDYYKKEAIQWAWELLTKVWGLPKNRLWATVYNADGEAEKLWKSVTDIDPSHVLRFGEKENFWEMGETGPCGPCSEIHMDRTPNGTATANLVNAGLPEVMEIWNLVFIQYNRDSSGKLTPLPAKHVDTGMGFERICAVLQNKDSNYDTDVFTPLINKISEVTRKPYDGRLDGSIGKTQVETDTAMRVIADHIRTLTFAIADGATPSNEGRGYVLRRILRRAARFGRNLGMHEPFLYALVPTLVETMGHMFPEIRTQHEHVEKVLKGEEEGFNLTLDRGLEIFESVAREIGHSKTFPGDDAFRLYDTFGFPLDLTELMAAERGMKVDVGRFTELMEEQRERSRESGKSAGLPGIIKFMRRDTHKSPTEFVGYDAPESESSVQTLADGYVVLDKTPFYGESGGQVGDTGVLLAKDRILHVLDTQKDGDVIGHKIAEESPDPGVLVTARIDKKRRDSIMRNHTATHLVHAALRKILGTHVHQAGSLVAPDHLRFDFAHFSKVNDGELAEIEALVNEKIDEDLKLVHHRNIPYDDAKKMGALMFFGDKYGDRVNVVDFGPFSKEFCGGTHVKSTKEIGYFKFRSEGSVASGVRRIEAVTAEYALEFLKMQDRTIVERIEYAFEQYDQATHMMAELFALSETPPSLSHDTLGKLRQALEILKDSPKLAEKADKELNSFFDKQTSRARTVEDIVLRLADIRKNIEKELSKSRVKSQSTSMDGLVQSGIPVNGFKLVSSKVTAASTDELKSLGDALRARLGSGVGLLAAVIDEKVSLVCVVTDDLVSSKKVEAGKIVGAVAKLVGGGGGGRPHMATAGGKDVAKLDEAIAKTKSIVESFLHS
ncbi:MAG: alanine--tRNA ligase [Bacteroidota bacterium]